MQIRHGFTSPLRYPGGKGALANFIKRVIIKNKLFDCEYVELYAGGASIAWSLLFEEYAWRVHINDLDQAVMAFWWSVVDETEELCGLIRETPVTIDEWHKQRQIQEEPGRHSRLQLGFSTFFLNRTNRSGILRGGVIGGKSQGGEWKLDARYNKPDLIARIRRIARYRSRIVLSQKDAADYIRTDLRKLPPNTLVYLDPPYFHKGQELYRNHYSPRDHAQIAQLVRALGKPWIVSYDAAPEILALYKGHATLEYDIEYSAQDRYAGAEAIFASKRLVLPAVAHPMGLSAPSRA